MEDKKNPNYRISLQFSSQDPEQVEVVNLLKQMGRKKSSFITKAIKYYLNEQPNAEVPGVNSVAVSKSSIRSIVKELLSEMNIAQIANETYKPTVKEEKQKTVAVKPKEQVSEPQDEISDEQLDDFLDSLDSWK